MVNSLRIVETLFAAGPADLRAWSCLLDKSVHLRSGNRPMAIGRAAVLEELGAFLAGVASIGHAYREVWALEEATLVETDVLPRTKRAGPCGAPAPALPCAMVFRTGAGALALDLRFYLDPAPVFGQAAACGARRPLRRAGAR